MEILKVVLWISIFLIFYSYFGYALLIWIYLKFGRNINSDLEQPNPGFEPPVSLIVAVFNEEEILQKKIENCLEINYPKDKLKLIFVTDGSTDNSTSIIGQYPQIELLHRNERRGKVAAINRTMTSVTTEFVVFCDANTFLNKDCIKEIIKHYSCENIGAVAGEKKVITPQRLEKPVKEGEGIYWKYESKLKKIDSDFYTVVGAAGELFSIRTKLFEPVTEDVLLDDFIISMNICKNGYRVIYEPKAYAMETASLTMKDEQRRKIRISAGGFQSILMLRDLLNIFKYGKLAFLYISHRVSRWVLCPILLPLIFICNLLIVQFSSDEIFNIYGVLFLVQISFYILALLGWIFSLYNKKNAVFYVPYYFVFMNMTLYIGFVRFLNKKQTVLWEKARRK